MKTVKRKHEFRARTKPFAGSVIQFHMGLDKQKEELRVIGIQMIRSGTSVAASYREVSRARSNDEFVSKIDICCQEADESQLWLELLRDECRIPASLTDPIWKEADELISIFVTISKNTKMKIK
jgi:four helix bundle protein